LKSQLILTFYLLNLSLIAQIGDIRVKKSSGDGKFKEVKIYTSKEKYDSTITDHYFFNDSGLVIKHISFQRIDSKPDTSGILYSSYDSIKRIKKETGWYYEQNRRKPLETEWFYPDQETTVIKNNLDGMYSESRIKTSTRLNKTIRECYRNGEFKFIQKIKRKRHKQIIRQRNKGMLRRTKVIDHYDLKDKIFQIDYVEYSRKHQIRKHSTFIELNEQGERLSECNVYYWDIIDKYPCSYYQYIR
jgi:hypothetical protein